MAASLARAAPPTACTPIANAAPLLHPGALVLAPEGQQAPMGARLRDLGPTSLTVSADGGESWVCMPDCGVHPLPGHPHPDMTAWSIKTKPVSMGDRHWSGVFHVGSLHASPPATTPKIRATTR